MKKIFFLLLLSLTFNQAQSQSITSLKSNAYLSIDQMVFDENNNKYVLGRYKGTPETFRLTQSDKTKSYIAKLDENNQTIWAQPIDQKKLRFNLHYENQKLYILATTNDYNKETRKKTAAAFLEVFSSEEGNILKNIALGSALGKNPVFKGEFTKNRILIQFQWRGSEENTLNGKTLEKNKYSAVLFQDFDLEGNKIWETQIEGGFNNFTDIRIGDVAFDKEGSAYVISYFSESLVIDDKTYTTKIHFDHPKLPLYFNGSFLMKINTDGKIVESLEISKYNIQFEHISIEENKIYLTGFYKGNKAYSDANEKNDIPVEFMSQTLPDCAINEGSKQVSEDLLVACLDLNFALIWKKHIQSSSNVRSKAINVHKGELTVSAISSSTTKIGDTTIDGFNTDGFADAFNVTFNDKGELINILAFHGPRTVFATAYRDNRGGLVTAVLYKEYVNINDSKILGSSSSSNTLIYESESTQVNTPEANGDNSLKVGDKVMGNWKGGGKFYPGKIAKIEGKKYFIQYDDGDTEWTTEKYIQK